MVDRTGKDVYDKGMRETCCPQENPPRTVEGRVTALVKSIDRLMDLIKRLSERYESVMLPSNPGIKETCGKPEVVSTVTCNLERELDRLYEASEELSGMIDRCNL
jgi:hypothetical protein